MRITKKVFYDLAILMLAFGAGIGLFFPLWVIVLGVPSSVSLTFTFFAACILAGLIAGVVNFALAKLIVGRRIKSLRDGMSSLAKDLGEIASASKADHEGIDTANHVGEYCYLDIDSEDEIGESASAFNNLVDTTKDTLLSEQAVREFSKSMASQQEVPSLAKAALASFIKYTSATSCAFFNIEKIDPDLIEAVNISDPNAVVESGLILDVQRSAKTIDKEYPTGLIFKSSNNKSLVQAIIKPIVRNSAVIGVVALFTEDRFNPSDRYMITMFGEVLSIALNNVQNHQKLEKMAAFDSLTEIYNRHSGLTRLHEEYTRHLRSGSPLGLIMLDLDFFKQINDTYGHLAGDVVLNRIAKVIGNVLRESDILLRYGGEEFMIALPLASINEVIIVAERIREVIQKQRITHGECKIQTTASMGVVSIPEYPVSDETEFIQAADEALYFAKEKGRNKVIIAGSMDSTFAGFTDL